MIKTRTQKIALLGVLGALALALSAAESFLMPDIAILPPGAKPGLSNIVTIHRYYQSGSCPCHKGSDCVLNEPYGWHTQRISDDNTAESQKRQHKLYRDRHFIRSHA